MPALVQVYNNTIHISIGLTPHFVVFGRHARLPVDLCVEGQPPQERATLDGWVSYHGMGMVMGMVMLWSKLYNASMGPCCPLLCSFLRLLIDTPLLPCEDQLIGHGCRLSARLSGQPRLVEPQLNWI